MLIYCLMCNSTADLLKDSEVFFCIPCQKLYKVEVQVRKQLEWDRLNLDWKPLTNAEDCGSIPATGEMNDKTKNTIEEVRSPKEIFYKFIEKFRG